MNDRLEPNATSRAAIGGQFRYLLPMAALPFDPGTAVLSLRAALCVGDWAGASSALRRFGVTSITRPR